MTTRTTALHGSGLWQRIHAALDGSTKKSAAIAYLGSNAPVLLRSFCAGDLLICDMSKRSLRSGATDPAAVRELIERGLDVRNRPGVHAKVLTTPTKVVVGSMNASSNSALRLTEAAILIEDRRIAADFRAWIAGLASEATPIDDRYLKSAEKVFRPPRGLGTSPPQNGDRVTFSAFYWAEEPTSVTRSVQVHPVSPWPDSRWSFHETWEVEPWPTGRWVVPVIDGQAYPPQRSVDNWPVGGRSKQHVTRWLAPDVEPLPIEDVAAMLLAMGVCNLNTARVGHGNGVTVKADGLRTALGKIFAVDLDVVASTI